MTAATPPAAERTPEGLSVTLRPGGWTRIISIVFLPLWLGAWAVGEVFALNALLSLLGSDLRPWFPLPLPTFGRWPPPPGLLLVIVPLLAWLAFWTWGGVTALVHLGRAIAGRDVILFGPTAVAVCQHVGPLRRRRTFERLTLQTAVVERRNGSLVLIDEAGRRHAITSFGSPDERRWLRDRLREHYGLRPPEPPPVAPRPGGWDEAAQADGSSRLVSVQRHQPKSIGCAGALVVFWWVPVLWLVWLAVTSWESIAGPVVLMAVGLLPLGVFVWTVFGRRVRLVAQNRFEDWVDLFGRRRHRVHRRGRFRVKHSSDSDGDDWYELVLQPFDGGQHVTVERVMNRPDDVLTWAVYLKTKTGWPLEIDPAARAREE